MAISALPVQELQLVQRKLSIKTNLRSLKLKLTDETQQNKNKHT